MAVNPLDNDNFPFVRNANNNAFLALFDAFYEKFNAAREKAKNILDRVICKRIHEQGFSYEIHIVINNEQFEINCRPGKVRTKYFFRRYATTDSGLIHAKVENEIMERAPAGDGNIVCQCDETAFKMLAYFAMNRNSVVKYALIDLPPIPTKFPSNLEWKPQHLNVTVDKKITVSRFVVDWLNRILPPSGVETLEITSPNLVDMTPKNTVFRNLENIEKLTINARARIDIGFIMQYPNMNIFYNDENGKSPISPEMFVKYWATVKKKNGDVRRTIEFKCKYSLDKLDSLVNDIRYDGGIYKNYTIHEPENSSTTRTFSVDENSLLIDVDTRSENNE